MPFAVYVKLKLTNVLEEADLALFNKISSMSGTSTVSSIGYFKVQSCSNLI